MNIIVAIKPVPDVVDAEIEIAASGDAIEPGELVFDINPWDACALEAALRLREAHGGTVTVVTVGGEEYDEVARRGLAAGADGAFRLWEDALTGCEARTVAALLAAFVASRPCDVFLAGVQSADAGSGEIGGRVAERLQWPWATLVTAMQPETSGWLVERELEGGATERVRLPGPAVLTVQTGIAQPRYVSVTALRKARSLPVTLLSPADLGLAGNWMDDLYLPVERVLSLPERQSSAEFIDGDADAIAARLLDLVGITEGGRS